MARRQPSCASQSQSLLSCSQQPLKAEYGNVLVGDIARVYDGDTITVNVPQWPDIVGEEVGIRVRGIDTPEIRGGCEAEEKKAREARGYVRARLEGADQVILEEIERRKYFRVVATVMIDGENIAEELIDRRLGREYEGGSRAGWCDE